MTEIPHTTPHSTPTGLAVRPVRGVFVHDTEAPSVDAFAEPHPDGSWHLEIDRRGRRHRFVADADVAWTVRACDRWHPYWLPDTRPWGASPANCWGLHVELASNQKFRDQGRPYTDAQYDELRRVVADWRARYGPVPVVGHGMVQRDRTDPVYLDWGRLADPLSRWPLAGTAAVDPIQGGWGFLDWTGDTYHPGVDLNAGGFCDADAGAAVSAPIGLSVVHVGFHVAASGRGFGHHLWAKADTGHYLHVCHLQRRPDCAEGDYLPRGRVFGLCGKTQGWACSHVHFEVRHAPPPGADWGYWPQGLRKATVAAQYLDPFMYLAATAADPDQEQESDMPILNEAQLVAVQAGAWGPLWEQVQPDFAIPAAWRVEVQAGRHPGRPVTPEQPVPDGSGAMVQWFETGRFATYVPGQPVSWNA